MLFDFGCRNESHIVLAASYIFHDNPEPSFLLVKLINFCWNMDLGLVIGCDAKDHHKNNLAEILRSFLLLLFI